MLIVRLGQLFLDEAAQDVTKAGQFLQLDGSVASTLTGENAYHCQTHSSHIFQRNSRDLFDQFQRCVASLVKGGIVGSKGQHSQELAILAEKRGADLATHLVRCYNVSRLEATPILSDVPRDSLGLLEP